MEIKNSQNELESLIAMAENVSFNIEDLSTKIANLRLMAMISFFCIYAVVGGISYLYANASVIKYLDNVMYVVSFLVAIIVGLASSYFLFQYFNKIKKLRYKLDTERDVLSDLLKLVFEYKDNLYSGEGASYVERAIIEMRLKRIGFSVK